MTLIINNVTNADIINDDMGFTIPALSTYDLSYVPIEVVAASAELATEIAAGNITVDADTLNALSGSTGKVQVSSTQLGIDTYTGQLCYYDATIGKYMGIAIISLVLANGNAADQSWLYINSDINSAQMGYVSSIYGTVTTLTAYTDTPAIAKSIAVWVNNTEYTDTIVLGAAQNANAVSTNIDFNIGDTVRLRVNSDTPGPVGAVYVTAFFHVKGNIA